MRVTLAVVSLAAVLAGCGGGASTSARTPMGAEVRTAFLKTLDAELTAPGWTAKIGSQCQDQNTGIPIGQLTSAELSAADDDMLFHCSVDLVSATDGQLGELYYVTVKAGGRWSAVWEPVPIVSGYDVKDPCAGAACTAVFTSLQYGDTLTGDTRGGHDTTPNGSSATPATSTGTHQQGFGGCPSGEDRNDTGYCIPLDDPGTMCAPDEPSAACGSAGRGPTSPASEPAATQVPNSTEPAPAADAAAIASVVGFARSCQTITEARMDPSWALATFTSPAPSQYCFTHDADGETVLHRTAGTWHIATQFSDLSGGCPAGVPDDVLRAFAVKCPGL
jgi:hypothetical protein